MVKEQKFRSDLYYRLNVFPIRVPALRERPEDIPPLVRHYVREFSRQLGKTIDTTPTETVTTLISYPWPGNVRELQNVIERAVILLTTGSVFKVPSDDLRMPNNAPMNPTEAFPLSPPGEASAWNPSKGVDPPSLKEIWWQPDARRSLSGPEPQDAGIPGLEKYGVHSDVRKALKHSAT